MNAVDTLGMIGELLSWIGFGTGLPIFFVTSAVQFRDGNWLPCDVVIVERHGRRIGRWYAEAAFHERELFDSETPEVEHEVARGFVSEKHPETMRFEPRRSLNHAMHVLALTLLAVGCVGLIVSYLPVFVG